VETNDFESGYNAALHLITAGCKRIGLLSISNSLCISNKRTAGYIKALAENGMEPMPGDILLCGTDEANNIALAKELLSQKNRPDGLISTVEKLATTCYLAARELGLSIPKDVKLVCFSNLEAVSILNPSLTTITQPAFEMGAAAATILFKALAKPTMNLKNESVVIPSWLMVRDSSCN
jgi:LacI family transcriptional regulator